MASLLCEGAEVRQARHTDLVNMVRRVNGSGGGVVWTYLGVLSLVFLMWRVALRVKLPKPMFGEDALVLFRLESCSRTRHITE